MCTVKIGYFFNELKGSFMNKTAKLIGSLAVIIGISFLVLSLATAQRGQENTQSMACPNLSSSQCPGQAKACGDRCDTSSCTGTGCTKTEACEGKDTKTCCAQQAAEQVSQTLCPVMGGTVNEALFTEYQGKRVYFCCPSCKTEFEKDPQAYLSKLPQFSHSL